MEQEIISGSSNTITSWHLGAPCTSETIFQWVEKGRWGERWPGWAKREGERARGGISGKCPPREEEREEGFEEGEGGGGEVENLEGGEP